MNVKIERRSPLSFHSTPEQVELRDHWLVAMRYPDQGPGPYLVDLSHCAKWDFQSAELGDLTPWGVPMPGYPGGSTFAKGTLLNRLNATQATGWRLVGASPDGVLDSRNATDITDAVALLGLVGPYIFKIMEKLAALDFFKPGAPPPFLTQGPVSHVPCQVVSFANRPSHDDAVLISCSRGYARDMVHAVMDAGREFGLRPAGELVWTRWVDQFLTKEDA